MSSATNGRMCPLGAEGTESNESDTDGARVKGVNASRRDRGRTWRAVRPRHAFELRSRSFRIDVGVQCRAFANRPQILDPVRAFEEIELGGALLRREFYGGRERDLPEVDASRPLAI